MEVQFFDKTFEKFIASLEKVTIAKFLRTIDLLEMFGNNLGMPHSKKIEKDLFELRIRGIQEVRILYTFYKGEALLLHGFVKKTQKINLKELVMARGKLASLDKV